MPAIEIGKLVFFAVGIVLVLWFARRAGRSARKADELEAEARASRDLAAEDASSAAASAELAGSCAPEEIISQARATQQQAKLLATRTIDLARRAEASAQRLLRERRKQKDEGLALAERKNNDGQQR